MDANLNRKIHAAAGQLAGREQAHEVAKAKARELFGVESLRDLSDDQAEALLLKLNKEQRSSEDQLRAARQIITGEATITPGQIGYARDLFRELGWSQRYIGEFVWNRYQEMNWKAMPKRKAIGMIKILQKRLQSKQKGAMRSAQGADTTAAEESPQLERTGTNGR